MSNDEKQVLDELNRMGKSGFDANFQPEYLEASGDRIRVRWVASPALHQPMGLVHGGAYCSVIESVASIGGMLWLGERGHVVGVNNNTDFLRATREGVLEAVGEPIHRGRTQQLWRVQITNEAGKLVAQGQVRLQNIVDSAHLGH